MWLHRPKMIHTLQVHTREKLVAKWRRHVRVHKGIAAASVTFHERGGTTAYMTDFCANKNRNKHNLFRCGSIF